MCVRTHYNLVGNEILLNILNRTHIVLSSLPSQNEVAKDLSLFQNKHAEVMVPIQCSVIVYLKRINRKFQSHSTTQLQEFGITIHIASLIVSYRSDVRHEDGYHKGVTRLKR
ncbi:hypothetical protein TNIN_175481 [Trichonephila inaurata madagascariensis]|uniref:Uncharacterized protein n=1 Tax=Trichonephila inaurata madagascariensis TaxID=2747483 RepID=A0A8X7CPZ9_9ARAC|nr:hypothetical protein TNIN_175481 [Trichonephila inaurata madagascariensis]